MRSEVQFYSSVISIYLVYKTNFTFSVVHSTEDYAKQQEQMDFYKGWGSAFNRMEILLNNLIKK